MSRRDMASSSSSPCAACKFLRRKCTAECVFAPYFPPDQPHKFANVHKIFGASNITKLLNELPPHQREDAVNSLAYEAEARMKDPVYGCVGAISILQRQMQHLQRELAAAHADLARYTGALSNPGGPISQQVSPGGPNLGMAMGMAGMPIGVTIPAAVAMGNMAAGPSHPMQYQNQHQYQVSREQLVLEGTQLTREQLAELARVGGGSYEAGLAALGIGSGGGSPIGGGAPPPFNHSSRGGGGGGGGTGSDASSGGGVVANLGGHLSPP